MTFKGHIHVPDGKSSEDEAVRRVTHLAIGGHPDDSKYRTRDFVGSQLFVCSW
jgi:hypothetical protein